MHQRPDRLRLLDRIAEALRDAGTPFALVGASALAIHGVVRSTADQDLMTVESSYLQPARWATLEKSGVAVEIRKGDIFDPLAGVVRFEQAGERSVDLVIGKFRWQREALERATIPPGQTIPVVGAADLILLKLYAGGPQDAWDIQQMLATEDREALVAQVDAHLPELSAEAAALWRKILEG
jgi:hypothetical protein